MPVTNEINGNDTATAGELEKRRQLMSTINNAYQRSSGQNRRECSLSGRCQLTQTRLKYSFVALQCHNSKTAQMLATIQQ